MKIINKTTKKDVTREVLVKINKSLKANNLMSKELLTNKIS